MKSSKLVKAAVGLLSVAIVFLAGWMFGQGACPSVISMGVLTPAKSASLDHKVATVSVMFDFGDGSVVTANDVTLPKDAATLFDILTSLNEQNTIKLDYQDYGGELGVFIKKINDVPAAAATDKWWQYWVNNKYSEVGASAYRPQAGDVIEFKFTKGQQPTP